MNNTQIYRHGDVGAIVPIEKVPEGVTVLKVEGNGFILKHGTTTGHAHLLTGAGLEVWEDKEGRRYFAVTGEAHLTHEEHGPLTLPAGTYQVNYEQEVDHFTHTTREVID